MLLLQLLLAAVAGLAPVEQCAGEPAFAAVRAQFVAAVTKRDVDALAAIASADVVLDDPESEVGIERLRALMTEERGADFWRMLGPAADGGCSAGDGERILPSYAARLTGEEVMVAGAREPIRASPSESAKIKGYARYEWVERNFGDSGPDYWHVRLRSGRTGYIRSERIYSNYSPYAAFERRDGQWRMTRLRLVPAD